MNEVKQKTTIPSFPKNLFWDVDYNTIDWDRNKRWVIARVFNKSGWQDVKELWRFYPENEIKENIVKIRALDDRTLNLLRNFYEIPKDQFLCSTLKQSIPKLWI